MDLPAESPRFAALDGLRGVAILWVLLHQLIVVPAETTWERVVLWPANFGWVGVTLFFVLSGYLITGILLDTRDAPHRVSSFYARRGLRILPLYAALVALVFGASWCAGGAFGVDQLTAGEAASFWLMLGNWSQAAAGSFLVGALAVTWSVAIEEQFYLLWPWISWSLRPRGLGWLCVIVILGCCVGRIAAQSAGLNNVALYVSTWTRLDALAVGSLAAIAVRSGIEVSPKCLWSVLLLAGGAAAVGDFLGELNDPTDQYFPTPFSLGTGITLGALAGGALLLLLVDRSAPAWLLRPFESPWLRSFGLYSYGIYLTHGPIRAVIRDHLFGPSVEGASPLVVFRTMAGTQLPALAIYAAICLPLCWAAGWLCYRLIERPCLRLKDRFPAHGTKP